MASVGVLRCFGAAFFAPPEADFFFAPVFLAAALLTDFARFFAGFAVPSPATAGEVAFSSLAGWFFGVLGTGSVVLGSRTQLLVERTFASGF